jgi:regulator of microtubule dynamics protein 3
MTRRSLNLSMTKAKFVLFLFILTAGYSGSLRAEDCDIHLNNGDNYYQHFENLEALEEYEKAYEICPERFESLVKLTRAYNDVGEDIKGTSSNGTMPVEAEIYFQKALQHSKLLRDNFPKNSETYFLLALSQGNISVYKGGKDKVKYGRNVEEFVKKAIELDPNFAPSYVILGIYYRKVAGLNGLVKTVAKSFLGGLPEGTLQDSEKVLLKALELSPDSPYVHFDLAQTYEEMGQRDKAIEHYNRVIELPLVDHDDRRKKTISEGRLEKLNIDESPAQVNGDSLLLRDSE